MFKTCPRCGDEFQAWISECPDCRVALQHAVPVGTTVAPELSAPAAALPLAAPTLLRRGEPSELRALAERLEQRGIACAVDTDPPGAGIPGTTGARRAAFGRETRLALYIEQRDLAASLEIQHAWLTAELPDAERAGPVGELSACPGCDEPLAANAAACASCGLEFPELETLCSACSQPVAPDRESCPHCGYRP